MTTFRLIACVLASGSVFALSLPQAAAQAQSPTCAKASAARAVHSKDYPRLQEACQKEKRGPKGGGPSAAPKSGGGSPGKSFANPFNMGGGGGGHKSHPSSSSKRSDGGISIGGIRLGGGHSHKRPRAEPTRPAAYPVTPSPAAAPAPATPAQAPAPAAPPAPTPAAAPAPAPAAGIQPAAFTPTPTPTPATGAVAPTNPAAAALSDANAKVFIVKLGEPLRTPLCAEDATRDSALLSSLTKPGATPQRIEASCRFAPDALGGNARATARRLANATVDPLPPGVDFSLVAVASRRCPDWVNASGGCVLGVTTKDDTIIGVAFLTGDDQVQVENGLGEKYPWKPLSPEAAVCQDPSAAGSKKAMNRAWEDTGLRVSYQPLGGLSCRQGKVLVETEAMRRLFAPKGKRQVGQMR